LSFLKNKKILITVIVLLVGGFLFYFITRPEKDTDVDNESTPNNAYIFPTPNSQTRALQQTLDFMALYGVTRINDDVATQTNIPKINNIVPFTVIPNKAMVIDGIGFDPSFNKLYVDGKYIGNFNSPDGKTLLIILKDAEVLEENFDYGVHEVYVKNSNGSSNSKNFILNHDAS
jgi:hypothetical protein